MVGTNIEIGHFDSRDDFLSAAMATLAKALDWELVDGWIQHPQSDFKMQVIASAANNTYINFRMTNGKYQRNWQPPTNVISTNHIWFWNIIKTSCGVTAIGLQNRRIDNGQWATITDHPYVFAANANGNWTCISSADGAITTVSNSIYFYPVEQSTGYNINYNALQNDAFNLAFTKFPDPIRGSTLNGLYMPLFSPKSTYKGEYYLNDKRYCNVISSAFVVAVALD